MDASSSFLSRVGLAISMYSSSKAGDGEGGGRAGSPVAGEEQSFSSIRNSELYPHNRKVVDKGCPATVQPFPSLSGEALEYIGLLAEDSYYIAISNYRFFVSRPNGFFNVPTGLIDAVELYGSKEQIVVLCKDGGSFCVSFDSQSPCTIWLERLRRAIRGAKDVDKTFAFVHWAYSRDQLATPTGQATPPNINGGVDTPNRDQGQVYGSDVVRAEFHRMQMDVGGSWRISDTNCEYKLCPTYPKLLIVPSCLSEEDLRAAGRFRALGRVPTVVWRHTGNGAVIARSSQPLVGVLGWRNSEDEKLLLSISQSCTLTPGHAHFEHSSSPVPIQYRNGGPAPQTMEDRGPMSQSVIITNGHTSSEPHTFEASHSQQTLQDAVQTRPEVVQDDREVCPELLVMDLRSYTAALGNRAKGGGCECTDYYPNCEVVYKNLPNIHSVRKSFQQLRGVLLSGDQGNFLSNLESTQWLHYLCQLISVACDVVQTVHDEAKPVLVHCSDGWDRTPQVVPLAQLMLDPYYRTIEGFQVLIEREWLGFGHRFSDRCGQHAGCSDPNQRCPVFLQWLDCVHQLVLQFPCHFQFNLTFLVKLGLHSYSCLYGTLLGNSMKEREVARVATRTLSLWSLLGPHNPEVINHLYTNSGPQVLRPEAHILKMQLWQAMFTGSSFSPTSALCYTTTNCHPTPATTGEEREREEQKEARPVLPVEVEMKEMVNVVSPSATRNRHSDSSFASVSSSPSPSSPLPPPPGEPDICPPGALEGEEEERSSKERESLKQTNEKLSSVDLPAQVSPGSSQNTPIATGSTHTNHVAPPPLMSHPPAPESPLTTSPLPPALPHRNHRRLNSDLLHDAIHDQSPRQRGTFLNGARHISSRTHTLTETGTVEGCVVLDRDGERWSGVRLESDGLVGRATEADWRLTRVLESYEKRVAELKREIVEVRSALRECVREGGRRRRRESREERAVEEEEAATAGVSALEDNQSPLSLASWDCVEDGDGLGVKWVPDHAATHCQNCAAAFSIIIRKHHCRACGDVFCHACTNYKCPVPEQHLYTDVRVCSRCYNRLDGHLLPDTTGPT